LRKLNAISSSNFQDLCFSGMSHVVATTTKSPIGVIQKSGEIESADGARSMNVWLSERGGFVASIIRGGEGSVEQENLPNKAERLLPFPIMGDADP
jgi:hypothetical protein